MKENHFNQLVKSIKQSGAIRRGSRKPCRMFLHPETEIAKLRKHLGASQSEFAAMIQVSVGTIRNWEQGRRTPQGPARALLSLVAALPIESRKVLGRD
ncbi:MAG: helix-turn-helix domain-containing protein [Bacteroidota bacterium]|nr:helix-turn-helix domain-containing protein [Bacteroidota bacterium]MDP4230893.1 helix-turn-helix domain-containing protein [Bacteroidota bacterium]MDP4237056.1 helix-turn-helix domain-containing protein [Bacteroidota bacterium]